MRNKKLIKRIKLIYSTRTNGIIENMNNDPFDVRDKFYKLKKLFKQWFLIYYDPKDMLVQMNY